VRTALVTAALVLAIAPGAAAAVPEIHSHRGGPLEEGVAAQPEDTQVAFERAFELGTAVVELDAKLSTDDVPVVIHDATLDRTTDCSGRVDSKTAAEIAACHVDILGTDTTIKEVPGAQVPVSRLSDVLAWAKANSVRLNLEIKNIPTDPDFDTSPAFARAILGAVQASGIRQDLVLIQSFWPPNLDEAKAAGFRTSFLTLAQTNEQSIEFATARGYDVLSPGWPVSKAYVDRAHAAGKQVVPYTFNKGDEVRAAVEAGVDAVITNDTLVAQRAIHGVDCPTARTRLAKRRAALESARRARAKAKTKDARARAVARVRSTNSARQAAKRLRRAACAGR
jgi:glycerophosphoryl diester phosphodiesterase